MKSQSSDRITLRLVQLVIGRDRSCRKPATPPGAPQIQINRLIDIPARLREFLPDGLLQPRARRRTALFQQKRQPAAVAQRLAQRRQSVQRGRLACVRCRCGRSAWRGPDRKGSGPRPGPDGSVPPLLSGMVGIALDLGRAAVAGFDHQRHAPRAGWAWPWQNTAARRAT